ncbi:MAG: CDP-alcohol phosphatidyltransferase family protein [Acetobacteraceae bacterium]|nr:CDP-alcohol phosphatidyltransferase family protein [Acetobacteraceae bacterium]
MRSSDLRMPVLRIDPLASYHRVEVIQAGGERLMDLGAGMGRLANLEERLRDRILGPVLDLIVPRWVLPTHISLARLGLVGAAVVMFLADSALPSQVIVLLVAGATDFIDGVLARRRRQCTTLGSFVDQVVDWTLGAWMGCLVIINRLMLWHLALLMALPQAVVFATDRSLHRTVRSVTAAAAGRSAAAQGVGRTAEAGTDLDPDIRQMRPRPLDRANSLGRTQFLVVLSGFGLLLLGKAYRQRAAMAAGYALLYLEVAIAFVVAGQNLWRAVRRRG